MYHLEKQNTMIIYCILYVIGAFFLMYLGSIAQKYHLTPGHSKETRKRVEFPLYEWLTSFCVMRWRYIFFILGFVKKDPITTHEMFYFVNGNERDLHPIKNLFLDWVWPVTFAGFIIKMLVHLIIWIVTIGQFEFLFSKEPISDFRPLPSRDLNDSF